MKQINGFERYLISPNGLVYDTELNIYISNWIDNYGYLMCVLRKEGKKYYKRIHTLVADAYVPNPNNLPQVNHKDGNKLNPNAYNLEYTTNQLNTQHGYDNGLYRFETRSYPVNVYQKSNHELVNTYKSIRNLSEDLNLNRKTVSAILNGTKKTNNYDYLFEYVKESQTTIENVSG